jgi:hypothetical protein
MQGVCQGDCLKPAEFKDIPAPLSGESKHPVHVLVVVRLVLAVVKLVFIIIEFLLSLSRRITSALRLSSRTRV